MEGRNDDPYFMTWAEMEEPLDKEVDETEILSYRMKYLGRDTADLEKEYDELVAQQDFSDFDMENLCWENVVEHWIMTYNSSEGEEKRPLPPIPSGIRPESDEYILEALKKRAVKESQSQDLFYTRNTGVPREEEWVGGYGVVVGLLKIFHIEEHFDCSELPIQSGFPISPDVVEHARLDNNGALFILLVEDMDSYYDLLSSKFWEKFPCIILSGGERPDVGVKLLLRKLKMQFKLPVFALFNSNPKGFSLLAYYGSGFIDDKGVEMPPMDIKWLGLYLSEMDELWLLDKYRSPMKVEKDYKEFLDTKGSIFEGKPEWAKEYRLMMETEKTVELAVLDNYFGLHYFTNIYLPWKLQKASKEET